MADTSYEDVVLNRPGFPFSPLVRDRYLANVPMGIDDARVLGDREFLLVKTPRDYTSAFTLRLAKDLLYLPFVEGVTNE